MTNFQNFALAHAVNSLNKSETVRNQNAKYYIRDKNRIELVIDPGQNNQSIIESISGGSYSFFMNPEFTENGIDLVPEDSSVNRLEIRAELEQVFPVGNAIFAALDAVEAAKTTT